MSLPIWQTKCWVGSPGTGMSLRILTKTDHNRKLCRVVGLQLITPLAQNFGWHTCSNNKIFSHLYPRSKLWTTYTYHSILVFYVLPLFLSLQNTNWCVDLKSNFLVSKMINIKAWVQVNGEHKSPTFWYSSWHSDIFIFSLYFTCLFKDEWKY